MFERDIFHHYQLYCENKCTIHNYRYFESNGDQFVVVPKKKMTIDRIEELLYYGDYLQYRGERGVAELCPTLTNMPNAHVDGEPVLLYRLAPWEDTREERRELGEELALFHRNGKGVPLPPYPTESILFGNWAPLWMERVDRAREQYHKVFLKPVKTEFDQLFLTTFPYYEGISENAIQYIIDYEMEDAPREEFVPTICHDRFQVTSWLQRDNDYVKLPTGWVVDHPVRDLAEWIRSLVFQPSFEPTAIVSFLDEYEKVTPLNRENWRLLYGRLLFPVWYYDFLETHYENEYDFGKKASERAFLSCLQLEEQNEAFLRSFFPMIGLRAEEHYIPLVDWLTPL
ncbi:hypothetical protein A374_02969 [Fictibacillus macauensis ZFHKF-1]|uniref:Spore coat protein YutH n=1 Tax=Fictibacillus macauensis ZFHKF-1 TaxID=1196324 RepID=I8J5U9_9BACL|nr:spore coat protein YutH [Fictibacillus macauensis]EIT87181.1 hypothetical protein A374_02969 [Fictibacillus macauensis ZFHKF-1]